MPFIRRTVFLRTIYPAKVPRVNHCFSSFEVKLPSPKGILSFVVKKVKKHCSRDLVWRIHVESQNTNLELCTRSCVKSKLISLTFSSIFKIHSIDLSSNVRACKREGKTSSTWANVSSKHSPNTVARLSHNSIDHGVVGVNMVVTGCSSQHSASKRLS